MTTTFRHLFLGVAILAVAVAVAVAAPGAFADTKSHRQAAEDVLKAMNIDKQFSMVIDQSLDAQIKANPQLGPYRATLKQFFDKYMSWDSLKDELVTSYANTFTEKELKEIIAFYKTPAGKKLVEKTPELTSQGMQRGMRRLQEHQVELQQMLQQAIQGGQQPKR